MSLGYVVSLTIAQMGYARNGNQNYSGFAMTMGPTSSLR